MLVTSILSFSNSIFQSLFFGGVVKLVGWLVVLGFNTALTAKVISWRSVTHMFPGFLTPVLTQLFFPKLPTSFPHASAEVRGKNTLERKFASTGDQTRNPQVMSLTRSPLSHLGGLRVVKSLDCVVKSLRVLAL